MLCSPRKGYTHHQQRGRYMLNNSYLFNICILSTTKTAAAANERAPTIHVLQLQGTVIQSINNLHHSSHYHNVYLSPNSSTTNRPDSLNSRRLLLRNRMAEKKVWRRKCATTNTGKEMEERHQQLYQQRVQNMAEPVGELLEGRAVGRSLRNKWKKIYNSGSPLHWAKTEFFIMCLIWKSSRRKYIHSTSCYGASLSVQMWTEKEEK